jgi:hypothetical protein
MQCQMLSGPTMTENVLHLAVTSKFGGAKLSTLDLSGLAESGNAVGVQVSYPKLMITF